VSWSLVSVTRAVAKRLAADWLIVAAALVTIVLATTLLASGPVYADAVTISALRQSLADAPVQEANLSIEADIFPSFYDTTAGVVETTLTDSLSATGADVFAYIEADSYELIGQESDETDQESVDDLVDLASFRYYESIETRATLVDGEWPVHTSAPFEAAIPRSVADSLGLSVGARFDVANRLDSTIGSSVVIVGIYEVDDATDPYWFEDRLAVVGLVESPSFRTHGPFVVAFESMFEAFTPGRSGAGWRALPLYDNLSVSEVNELRTQVGLLERDLNDKFRLLLGDNAEGNSELAVSTGLLPLLAEMDRSLTVTRSSVLALLVQLAILAGYALALTAGLLADTRRAETTLLRSRGASPGQVLATSVLEGVVLTAPAALAAPFLAAFLLQSLNTVGPLAAVGLTIDPEPTREGFIVAAVAAILSIVALAWPAYSRARGFISSRPRHQRQRRRSPAQRVGFDLALLALAVVVFWQLQVIGPQLSAGVRGRFGVDPLLVIAPALGLLAGAVLALRVIPLMARIAEWLAVRGKATIGALASWQVARRPTRYARSSLLLIMAIGIGLFAASYSTTWITSQQDQADNAVGADLVVDPSRDVNNSITDLHLAVAHQAIDGVETSMPLSRARGTLAASEGLAQFVLLDAAKADGVVRIRDDVVPGFGDLMSELVAGRPTMAAVPLPGEPRAISLDFEAIEVLPETPPVEEGQPPPPEPTVAFNGRVRLIIKDGDGMLHRVSGSAIQVNEGPDQIEIDLSTPLAEDTVGLPSYPLSLINIEILSVLPEGSPREAELRFGGLQTLDAEGTWRRVPATMDWATWSPGVTSVVRAQARPTIATAPSPSPGWLAMAIETGQRGFSPAPVYYSIRPTGTDLPASFPILVSEDLIEPGIRDVGSQMSLPPLRIGRRVGEIAGTVGGFPTLDATAGSMVIADLATVRILSYEPGLGLGRVGEYWLDHSGDEDLIITDLLGGPLDTFAIDSRDDLAATMVADPVALATIGALTIGFVAAAVFAAVGFAVSATVSARERLVEFALLRALGLSPRQLGGWLSLEQGVLIGVSLAMGTLIGIVLTVAILPLISLTQDGAPAVPEVIVLFPWDTIAVLELAVLAVLVAIVVLMSVVLRRVGLGSHLRLGED
jgi:hypothetical protein